MMYFSFLHGTLWQFHMLFALSVFFGSVLLLLWLLKEGKKEVIQKVVLWTLTVGVLGLLLTSMGFGQFGRRSGQGGQGWSGMGPWMMNDDGVYELRKDLYLDRGDKPGS